MTSSVNNGGSASFDVYQNENFEVAPSSLQSSQPSTVPPPSKTVTLLRRDFTYRELVFTFASFAMAAAAFGLMIGVITEDQAVANEKKMATCTDYDCYVSAAAVQRKMNASVEPCDNFYEYACGQWIDNVKLLGNERERTVLLDLEKENMKRLNDAIMGEIHPLRNNECAYEFKLKTMFKTCLDQYQTTNLYEKNNPLLDQVKAMGGWYVLKTLNNSFYWSTAHREVLGRDNFVKVFFDYEVTPIHQQHRKFMILITEDRDIALPYSKWNIPGSPLLSGYKEFLRNIALLMAEDAFVSDTDLDSRIDTFVNDVITIEQGIADAMIKNEAEILGGSYQNKTLSSMSSVASIFDWISYFSKNFNESMNPVTYSTPVLVKSPRLLGDISSFIYSKIPYDKRSHMFNNYLVWRLVYSWLPEMSFEYNHLLLNWQAKLRGSTAGEYQPSWTQCMRIAQRYMREALDGLYIRRHFTRLDKAEVTFIAESVRKSVVKEIGKLSWMDDATRQIAAEKVTRVIEKIGYPKFMESDADMQNMLDSSYRQVRIDMTNHFTNIQQLRQHARRQLVTVFSLGLDPLSDWRNTPLYSVRSNYYYPWNELMVPAGLLEFPVFSGVSPAMFRMMTFGSAGYRLAHGYLDAIGELGQRFDKTGAGTTQWWSENTAKNYQSKKQCVRNWYSKIETGYLTLDSGAKLQRKLQSPDFYAMHAILDIGALRNAFSAYASSEVQSDPKTASQLFLPGTPAKNINEYFFLGFAQTFCAVRRDQATYELISQYPTFLPEKLLVNNLLMQLPEFSNTFQCPAGSTMNPGACSAVF